MADRTAKTERKTKETQVTVEMNLDGEGKYEVDTGIGFLDHMLAHFSKHGKIDLTLKADGDLQVDAHHTVEDVGLVLGDAFRQALDDRKGIKRYGHAVTPMDDALTVVTVDLSNRPFLAYHVGTTPGTPPPFDISLAKEFFQAFTNRCGMNLHINVSYGENEHHILEAIFKALARALDQASGFDERISGVRSTKGAL